jgi:hypothetical protein
MSAVGSVASSVGQMVVPAGLIKAFAMIGVSINPTLAGLATIAGVTITTVGTGVSRAIERFKNTWHDNKAKAPIKNALFGVEVDNSSKGKLHSSVIVSNDSVRGGSTTSLKRSLPSQTQPISVEPQVSPTQQQNILAHSPEGWVSHWEGCSTLQGRGSTSRKFSHK